MTCDGSTGEPPEPVQARGIVDRATGIEKARASRQWLFDDAKEVLGRTNDMIYDGHLLVMGLASRAAGLHDGVVHALGADNPLVAYTLLRSYAQNAAAALYERTTRPSFIGFSDLVVHARSRWAPSRTTRSKAPTDSNALPSNQFDFCRLY
ncbi:hypothetical protein DE4576_03983 [Mycobacterium marinum]|nr:hypothetical protein DE4576_03983 [Mycobacterium marinum]